MYSPKIREDLIPELYMLSKHVQKPMTKVVDDILRSYISFYKKNEVITPNTLKNVLEYVLEKERMDDR